MPQVNPIAIAVFCVLGAVVITLALLPVFTKTSSYTPPPKRGSWAPPYDPGNLPNIKPSNPHVCLPGTLGYNGLITCNRQADCKSCTDDSTLECVTVNNTNNQIVNADTKQLDPPVPIHLYRKANGTCSGRGTKKDCSDPNAPANCQDYWCDCGSQYTHANNDPTNCDVQILNVTQPGSYCLPSYVNKCNPYTSETVLTNSGSGSQWTCECKYYNPQLFQQNAEGTDCSVPIACGALEPQTVKNNIVNVLQYVGPNSGTSAQGCTALNPSTSVTENWKLCPSYPNQLASSSPSGNIPCTVPTSKTAVPIVDNQGNNYSFYQYDVSPLGDPKCFPQKFTNTCTLQTAFDAEGNVIATQVVRGSGTANDPQLSRLWPPFPNILPAGMQACPDGWTGSGTPTDPCTDTNKFKFSYLDKYGQWNGKYLSLQELRNVGYPLPGAKTCSVDKDCSTNQVCSSAGLCVTNAKTCTVNTDCSSNQTCTGAGVCATSCQGQSECASEAGTSCLNGVCSTINDTSCNISAGTAAIGLPGTLGALPWKTVNTGCSPVPPCIESGPLTLQQVKRSWSTPTDLFPVTSDNIGSTSCSTTQAPSCICPISTQNKSCSEDSGCNGKGLVCNAVPVLPKSCSSPSDCGGKACTNGQCSIACKIDSDCGQGQFCNPSGVCSVGLCGCGVDGSAYVCNDPAPGELCSAVTGLQPRPYDGALDGPVVDDNGLPSGGACSCQGFQVDDSGQKVPLIPGEWLDASLAWTCVPDPCFVAGTNSYYDSTRKQCVCGSDASGASYYSWNTNNGVPTCQRDPCNPSGATSSIQRACQTDEDCSTDKVTCANKLCYMWTDKPCDPSAGNRNCLEDITGGQSVLCLEKKPGENYCAVQDSTRPSCTLTSDCALGICNKDTKLCTGGCVCSAESEPFYTDANPLRSACTNACVFNPCGSNGTCEIVGNSYKCYCNDNYYGDSCENRKCLGPGEYCASDDQCCNNVCTYKFLVGYTCDHL